MTVLDSRHIAVFGGFILRANRLEAENDLYILVVRKRGRGEGGGRENGKSQARRAIGCFVSSLYCPSLPPSLLLSLPHRLSR